MKNLPAAIFFLIEPCTLLLEIYNLKIYNPESEERAMYNVVIATAETIRFICAQPKFCYCHGSSAVIGASQHYRLQSMAHQEQDSIDDFGQYLIRLHV